MLVYQVTQEERKLVEKFNETQKNTLLIVCDHEGLGPCVVLEDLSHADFKPWRDQFDIELRSQSVQEYDPNLATPLASK